MGYNSRLAYFLMERIFPNLDDVILFTIFIGTNDAVIPAYPKHIDIHEFVNNV